MNIDISMIINCHREKKLAQTSLSCFHALREQAEALDLTVEWVVIIDNGDEDTKAIVSSFPFLRTNDQVCEIQLGDTGLSRNFGASQAKGKYVCFFDADDLYSGGWLVGAYQLAMKFPENYLFHPEYTVYFDKASMWVKLKDQVSHGKNIATLARHNLWPYSVFLLRKHMQDLCYESAKATEGFGYEDWHWNCKGVSKGYVHKVVPKTVQFYRWKAAHLSRCQIHAEYHTIIKPSRLFNMLEKYV